VPRRFPVHSVWIHRLPVHEVGRVAPTSHNGPLDELHFLGQAVHRVYRRNPVLVDQDSDVARGSG
jgi:hypothetical protein